MSGNDNNKTVHRDDYFMNNEIQNMAVSVRAKLLDIARTSRQDLNRVLIRYGMERLLFRISRSRYKSHFVLKGVLLFYVWNETGFRSTKDIDLLGLDNPSQEDISGIFRELCLMESKSDGLIFHPETVTTEEILDQADFKGIRVKLIAKLESAKIHILVDIGFGDDIYSQPEERTLPSILCRSMTLHLFQQCISPP